MTIFFVISGYLITTLALREERRRGSLQIRSFFVRRAFRLLPLYYFVLLVSCVLIFGFGWSPEKREGLVGTLPYYFSLSSRVAAILGSPWEIREHPALIIVWATARSFS